MLPTQLLHTELKSQMLGMGGAGTGSLLYGRAEAATDVGGAVQEDLANVSDNAIDKLPPVEQEKKLRSTNRRSHPRLLRTGGGWFSITVSRCPST